MANEKIREHLRIKNVRMWELSAKLGYRTDGTLCRKLRLPVDSETEKHYLQLIDQIAREKRA